MGVPGRMGRAPVAPDPCWDKEAAAVAIHRVKSSDLHFKEGRRPWRAGVKFLGLLLPLRFRFGGDWVTLCMFGGTCQTKTVPGWGLWTFLGSLEMGRAVGVRFLLSSPAVS